MERIKTVFTCVGLRIVPGGIEVKFLHQDDQVVLRVPETAQVTLGHKYVMSMKLFDETVISQSPDLRGLEI